MATISKEKVLFFLLKVWFIHVCFVFAITLDYKSQFDDLSLPYVWQLQILGDNP